MQTIPKKAAGLFILAALALLALATLFQSNRTQAALQDPDVLQSPDAIQGPFVSEAVLPELSAALRDLPISFDEPTLNKEINPRHNPLLFEPDQGQRGTWQRSDVPLDPLIQTGLGDFGRTPGLDLSFEGTGNPAGCGSCSPPDTVGDVGPNHYVQMVNATKVAIYNKAGSLLSGPTNLSTFWGSGTCNSNAGDPIVLYDSLANRWLLSQFASPNHMCIAISQTADPTGTYHLYTFDVGSFPDYFKFGVWPDGYYMSANEGTYTAYAFDRAKMLTGAAATFQKFTGGANLYLPSDLDGPTAPPAGAPNYFYTFKDDSFHGGSDRIEIREFDVDWVTPGNSTFTLVTSLNISAFTYTVCGFFNFNCVQQAGTAQRLDTVSEWPMFRFPYRNFGSHQTMVGAFTVGGGLGEEGAAIRWFELRKTGGAWTLYQEGTFDPGDGHDRFMGSIAMDKAGNIALGYSVSSSTLNPAIRYATRLASDPLGSMQAEAVLINGAGSQTGSNRWGDYSAMSIDPANDCTFWYTNEYYPTNASSTWKTRIGAFTMPECLSAATPTPTATGPTPTPTITPTSSPTPATFCSAPALPIPDGDPTGVTDALPVVAAGTLSDLNVSINTSHTWVGDLVFTLEHVDTGTTVTIIDRPGVPASTFGCSGTDIDAILDDEAASPVEDECGLGVPTIDGTFIPNNPLSAFDGENLSGSWALTAADLEIAFVGTLNEWCLIPTIYSTSTPTPTSTSTPTPTPTPIPSTPTPTNPPMSPTPTESPAPGPSPTLTLTATASVPSTPTSTPPPIFKVWFPLILRMYSSNLIVNGGFEEGGSWFMPPTEYSASYSTAQTYNGDRSARTGIVNPDDNIYSYSSVWQQVYIPSNVVCAKLRFWLYPVSTETGELIFPTDLLGFNLPEAASDSEAQMVLILDPVTEHVLNALQIMRSDVREWIGYEFDLMDYSGYSFKLYFGTLNNGTGGVTSMYVDDVSLKVCSD